MTKNRKNTQKLIGLFKKYYPQAHCALEYNTPEQLTVATVLSAQCTDLRVNIVTRNLFKKYPDLEALSLASLPEIETEIHSTGFYKNKAKNLKALSEIVVKKYSGKVPQTIDELVALPGVGRKTANVVLGNAFGIASGVVVDTHVSRLSQRLGLTKEKTPEKIEQDLNKIIPKKYWVMFSHWLIWHGRGPCKARKPSCETCFLDSLCPKIL